MQNKGKKIIQNKSKLIFITPDKKKKTELPLQMVYNPEYR